MNNPTPQEGAENLEVGNSIRKGHHDYDREYRSGAHWDKGRPSSNMPFFLAYLKSGEKILDAGCGTGRDVFYLSGQGFEVVGVDSSQSGIELARHRAAEVGKPDLHFDIAPIEALPYDDESFDAAYSGYVLGGETFPQQIAELARVLKPGKILYIAMFTETKYETPCERDTDHPKPLVITAVSPFFEIVSDGEDTYEEEDDMGKHTHHRLKLVLRKKS